ncbi:hypothetical protein SAMN05444920_104158 [Nonomuraea solani]|uniref:Uncharacterized protein n=1 Tax=Nonomuraea solani TaxID=1144553 RepID=A0A1H6CNH9_9ACTN|nr:hypothetical protein SAMN05444920_104158 [Nonomuraea solani]
MAFSTDKGRHRRGRWWRRGSYLFSRRSEAPPGADRSFWSYAREKHQEARAAAKARNGAERRKRAGIGELSGRTEVSVGRREHRAWPGGGEQPDRVVWPGLDAPAERRQEASWDGFALRERGERLPAAVVVERPGYTWYDFELDDQPFRAQPNRPDAPSLGDGLRHCGRLESILHRQWDARQGPPPADVIRAVESLARLPERLKEKLAAGLEGIYVGPGGVPDLDDMGYLRGAPLPSGRATWDICAGAYGDRKIVVGDRPSPTPDVMMHEVGHAIDDVDSLYGDWVSDSPEFVLLYEMAMPVLASTFHRQGGGLGRKEFFADAFAAIAARQRPALVDMLGGDTRMALDIMLFFNRRYGI